MIYIFYKYICRLLSVLGILHCFEKMLYLDINMLNVTILEYYMLFNERINNRNEEVLNKQTDIFGIYSHLFLCINGEVVHL